MSRLEIDNIAVAALNASCFKTVNGKRYVATYEHQKSKRLDEKRGVSKP